LLKIYLCVYIVSRGKNTPTYVLKISHYAIGIMDTTKVTEIESMKYNKLDYI